MAEHIREDLADFVKRVRAQKGFSLKLVEDQSNGRIDKSYVNQIENRAVLSESISLKKLSGLAEGLQEPEEVVVAVARGKLPSDIKDLRELKLIEDWRSLPPSQRDDAEAFMQLLKLKAARLNENRRAGTQKNSDGVTQKVKKKRA
ncbi:MAG: hypothetical protein M3R15_11285 [Acidobacteriota bacterium]|nr:hypothetical protein [Acidobacteriota bacterium]